MDMQELIDCTNIATEVSKYLSANAYESYNTLKVNKDYEVKVVFGLGGGTRALIMDKNGKIKFSMFERDTTTKEFQAGNVLNLETVKFLEKYKYSEIDAR